MLDFAYDAVTPAGRRVSGRYSAATTDQARTALEHDGLLIIQMRAKRRRIQRRFVLRNSDVLDLTRSLAALQQAGMPLALSLANTAAAAPRCAGVLNDLQHRIEKGESFASALRAQPSTFSDIYIGVIAAGERAGDIGSALRRLVAHLEAQAALRSRLQSAAIYPAILAVASMLSAAFLVLYVLPRFAAVLADTGAALPRSTQLLMATVAILRRGWPLALGLVALLPIVPLIVSRSARLRYLASDTLLGVPVLGALRRNILTARFGALCAVMLRGGAPLTAVLTDAAASIGDPVAAEDVRNIRKEIETGRSFQVAVANARSFAPVLTQLVAVGEGAGQLAEFLAHAATVCAESAERRMLRFVTLAEPVVILGFGLMVGFIAISLLQAVYSVNSTVTAP